jgi:uncharacterized membrane protein
MVVFHFCYDLNYFKLAHIPLYSSSFWLNFRLLIVNMFLITAGMSLALAFSKGINWQKLKKRILLLGSASLTISIATFFVFPYTWVYFGVIHFVLVASIVGLFFINKPKLALALSVTIIVGYLFFNFNMHPIFAKIAPILHLPMRHTEDLVPFIPWFSATLLGIAIVGFSWHKLLFENRIFNANTKLHKFLSFIGKRALLIYLIHQPLIFGIIYLLVS